MTDHLPPDQPEPIRGHAAPADDPRAEARERVDPRPPADQSTPSGSDPRTEQTDPADVDTRVLSPPEGPGEIGRLGGYRVTKRLGRGGMGMVYAAHDPALRRDVAMKVMLPGMAADRVARERFLHEARAAARVFHDNLVPIWQVGECRGVPFLVMPLLAGVPLERGLAGGKSLRPEVAVRIARETAVGLAAAHAAGLVHRDVKPSNIWLELGPNGSVRRTRVLDFGLARLDHGGTDLTKSGMVVGTPSYMAPEQARGRRVDGRADLFSLGVVLYQMLTGKRPFRGPDSLAILTALAVDDPVPVRDLNPAVSPVLADLVHRLLSKDLDGRPASAAEVASTNSVGSRPARSRSTRTPATARPGGLARRPHPGTRQRIVLGPDHRPSDTQQAADAADPFPADRPVRRRRRGLRVARRGRRADRGLLVGLWDDSADVRVNCSDRDGAVARHRAELGCVRAEAGQGVRPGRAVEHDRPGRHSAPSPGWPTGPKRRACTGPFSTADDRWAERTDVYVDSTSDKGKRAGFLTVGFGERPDEVGPELTFGTIMGDRYDEPVFLLKFTQGAMSLADEARPPTAVGPTGEYYRGLIAAVESALAGPPDIGGMFAGRRYELAGMIWFQGWNDLIHPRT